MLPATPCILLSRSFSVSVTFSTKLGETPTPATPACNTTRAQCDVVSQLGGGGRHTGILWLAWMIPRAAWLSCAANLKTGQPGIVTDNQPAAAFIILTTFTVGVLSKDGIFYCWKCVVLNLWRALISWSFLAEHHRCKHKPEMRQRESLYWFVSSRQELWVWENIPILLSIIIHQREGEASCFKERKKINLYFNLDVNWSGGRRTSWYQPSLSLGLQWDRSSSSLNQLRTNIHYGFLSIIRSFLYLLLTILTCYAQAIKFSKLTFIFLSMIAKISDIFPVCSSNAQLKINATTFFFQCLHDLSQCHSQFNAK